MGKITSSKRVSDGNTNEGSKRKKVVASNLPETSSKIRKRIRDIKRTLNKPDVSLKVRVECERRLISLKYLYGERKVDEREKELAKKYHGIKHFERKKVHRKLKQIRKQIEDTKDKHQLELMEKKLQELLLDENYIDHFPKTIPYASLYANTDDDKRSTKKQDIRQEIKQAMENGNAFDDLQKKYRQLWKEKLISEGVIEDATPVMAEDKEDTSMVTTTDQELKHDDFFE